MALEWFQLFKEGRMDLEDDPRSGRPLSSRNADTVANIREMMTRDRRCTLRMMSDELNINKEAIHQSSMEIYGRGSCAQNSSHTDSRASRSSGDASCQGFIQTCQGNPSFLHCIFLSAKVETALKGKKFQDVEDIKKNVSAELNALPLEAFAGCFRKLFIHQMYSSWRR
jgi:hypothetical protein